MRSVIEFDYFDIEVWAHREGRYYPATQTSPGEQPYPVVDRCVLICGNSRSIVRFDELSPEVIEVVMDELMAEIDGLRESDPDLAREDRDERLAL